MFKLKDLDYKKILIDNAVLIGLILLVIFVISMDVTFISFGNLMNVLKQMSVNGLIALGMTLIILTGGIDLSVGSMLALVGAITADLLVKGVPVPIALLIGLMIGILLGLFNGLLVQKGKLQPFIATLGTMSAYRGLTMVYTSGRSISSLSDSALFKFIGRGTVLGIPVPGIILIIAFLIIIFLMSKTVFGINIYAIGGNEKAAKLSGVKISKTKIIVYILSGFLTSLAAIILISRLNATQPTFGVGYELDAIAAVVLGGTSLAGGRGSVKKTIIGILFIGILNNALNILEVSSYYQELAKGLLIIIAVLFDRNNK